VKPGNLPRPKPIAADLLRDLSFGDGWLTLVLATTLEQTQHVP